MANPEHLAKLLQETGTWNQWREQNSGIVPDFSGADLHEAWLGPLDLVGANLHAADLSGARLYGAELNGANLSGANLSHTNLIKAILFNTNLFKANLSRANLRLATLIHADLRSANLQDADLREANLREANVSHANLSESSLISASLNRANLTQANLYKADLRNANLNQANLSGANLAFAYLREASLVDTNLEGADLRGCSIYGISAWNVKLDRAIQSDLLITPENESPIQVDSLEMAQFIYLLLNNIKLRDVIDTIGKKAVLILGRFTPERKSILDAIREALRHRGYLPILFDFDKPSVRDTHETIVTLASMVRFIIADITDAKSIPQELVSIVPNLLSVPIQPVLQSGYEPWGMYDHIKRYPWVLPVVFYDNQGTLISALDSKVITPAEAKAKEQTRTNT